MAIVTGDFLLLLFQNVLGRIPTSAEAALWGNRIDQQIESGGQVALDILGSVEAQRSLAIERLYQSAFGRLPDLAGLKVQIGSGLPFETIARNFAGSPEFQANFTGNGSFDAGRFVEKLYTNILGRAPDTAGRDVQVNFYNSLLAGGQSAIQAQATLLQNFANAAEFIGNPQLNFDKAVLLYAGIDGAIPTSIAAFQATNWIAPLTLANSLNNGVTGDGVNYGALSGETFFDASIRGTVVAGTPQVDLFNAPWDGLAGTTFNGGSGDDVLTILRGTSADAAVTLNSIEKVIFNNLTTSIKLAVTVPGATIGGQIDTLAFAGVTGTNQIGIAAAGVEKITYELVDYPTSGTTGRAIVDFTGSTALSTLTLKGSGSSLTVKGFLGDTALSLTIDATQLVATNTTIDLSSYAGFANPTILGGDRGTGTGALIGSINNDIIRGGAGNDTIVGGVGADTLTGGGGDDLFRFDFSTTSGVNVVDTITDFSRAASPAASSGFDRIQIAGLPGNVAASVVANSNGVTAGLNWSLTGGKLAPAGAQLSLQQYLTIVDAAAPALGNSLFFSIDQDSYVFVQGGEQDFLIKLAGVGSPTGLNSTSSGALFIT